MIADRTAVYWQTIKPVSVSSWRTACTHDSIQRVGFMNAPKQSTQAWLTKVKEISEHNVTWPVHDWLPI